MTDTLTSITDLFGQIGLRIRLRRDALDEWDLVVNRLAYAPVAYSGAILDYHLAYVRGQQRDVSDLSVILLNDGRECGLWPLSLIAPTALGSNGSVILPPLFVADLPMTTCKRITSECLDFLEAFQRANGGDSLESRESFSGTLGMSPWHDKAMKRGSSATLRHDVFVDLSQDLARIKASLRKSYRSLIAAGERLWDVGILDHPDEAVWAQFRALHEAAAGRVTRSAETWDLQHAAIGRGAAFLVHLSDSTGRMVGAGLFQTTRDESLYGVGAYDRGLFDKPLGHVVQFRAIQELQKRHIRWHKLGNRSYPSEQPPPSPKELTISDFKQGFATHLLPRYELKLELH